MIHLIHWAAYFSLVLVSTGIMFAAVVLAKDLFSRNRNNANQRPCKYGHLIAGGGDHITWQEYFMSVAQLAARRSKDPSTKVGACIVNQQNKIVATGYNGMPNGVHDNMVPWTKEGDFLATKYAYVVHAELNAILNSVLTDQTGCRLFVSLFPCNECAKAIIQSGIKHVIYLSDKHKEKDSTRAAKAMFKMAGVRYEQFSESLVDTSCLIKPETLSPLEDDSWVKS